MSGECRFAAMCSMYGCQRTLMVRAPYSADDSFEQVKDRAIGIVKASAWGCDNLGFLCPVHVAEAIGARL